MSVSDISTFFQKSTRNNNDATNKVREKVLRLICNPPQEYLNDAEHGTSWRKVHEAWKDALKRVADLTNISEYTLTKIKVRGGRKYNYDADVMYYKEDILVGTRKIEFKNGGATLGDLPQILSLQAKVNLFSERYDKFWYENYLDKYLACDKDITQAKPTLEAYLKYATSTKYSITPFFAQLKAREEFFKKEKNTVVNSSITDYLEKHGKDIDISAFSEKIKKTQEDKIYLLWCEGKFCLDRLSNEEMTNMSFHSIKNGNVLELKAGNTLYGLLLRWRNHKGILNPAWQISMKRL